MPDIFDVNDPVVDNGDSSGVDPEKAKAIEQLKMLIQEHRAPYFEHDAEFQFYLDRNNGDIEAAAYEMLIIKSEDSQIMVSGLTTQDTSVYFKRLASRFRKFNSGTLQ